MARKKKKKKLTCASCNKEKVLNDYFKIKGKYTSRDNRTFFCKRCMREKSYYDPDVQDKIDIKGFQTALMGIDMPFINDVFKSAQNSNGETVGSYFRILSLPQYSKLRSWDYSQFVDDEEKNEQYKRDLMDELEYLKVSSDDSRIEIIPGYWEYIEVLQDKWGQSYVVDDLRALEKIYIQLEKYVITEKSLDEMNLQDACKARFLYDKAIEEDAKASDIDRYRKNKDAAFKSLKRIDDNGDISSVSLLFKKVDEIDGGLEILEDYTKYPRDQIDMIAYLLVAKNREHQGLSVDRDDFNEKDMGKFYDEMAEQYKKQLKKEGKNELLDSITV